MKTGHACRTVKAAAALLGLSWDAVQTIIDRAVARGLEQRESMAIKHIGIDENTGRTNGSG
ncbi:MAG: hypothetical protein NT171_13500 [Planctomycetota bacterium]|nr:hypothetical protein [Planctomycetota bacterium]